MTLRGEKSGLKFCRQRLAHEEHNFRAGIERAFLVQNIIMDGASLPKTETRGREEQKTNAASAPLIRSKDCVNPAPSEARDSRNLYQNKRVDVTLHGTKCDPGPPP